MDSINRQQPEENFKDLAGQEALKKIRELAEKASTCFFCTSLKQGQAFATRPMSLQQFDEQGILWFLSASDSHKNAQISEDPSVQLLFQGSDYSDYLTLYGRASVSKDHARIKELWKPILKTWFTEGVDDPRITVLRIEPLEGYYWDTKHNQMIGLIKRAAGAILGKTLDDSIEGKLRV